MALSIIMSIMVAVEKDYLLLLMEPPLDFEIFVGDAMLQLIEAPDVATAFPVFAFNLPAEILEPDDALSDTLLVVPVTFILEPLEIEHAIDEAVAFRLITEPLDDSIPINDAFTLVPFMEAPLDVSSSSSSHLGEKPVGRVMLEPDDASNDAMLGDMTVIEASFEMLRMLSVTPSSSSSPLVFTVILS